MGAATITTNPTAIIIFFIDVFLSLTIEIGLGNIFTLATFPSPPTQSYGRQVDSCKGFHGLLLSVCVSLTGLTGFARLRIRIGDIRFSLWD